MPGWTVPVLQPARSVRPRHPCRAPNHHVFATEPFAGRVGIRMPGSVTVGLGTAWGRPGSVRRKADAAGSRVPHSRHHGLGRLHHPAPLPGQV